MSQVRCAIYTRKSTDEGLDQAFNSLDAQREACEAYIQSQRHEGWKLLPRRYDDGGASGGNLDRKALEHLLADIDAGRVDMVVVYKIDRLTRSLADFAKLVERFDAAGCSFVSVTQQFNTSTSMGRLTLNVLLSFAQFEREVTAERIRDKIAASKKKGMWMGGVPPFGYQRSDHGLVIEPSEAATVRALFEAYLDVRCVRRLSELAEARGFRTRQMGHKSGRQVGGKAFSRGALYHLLANPIYVGKIRHKTDIYDGLHEAIVDQAVFDRVQEQLSANRVSRKSRSNAAAPSRLAGKIFKADGVMLTPSHTKKSGRRYRYYVSTGGARSWRLPANEIETAVEQALQGDVDVRHYVEEGPRAAYDMLDRVQIGENTLAIEVTIPKVGKKVIRARFTERRRGVERKILLHSQIAGTRDQVLIRRIHRALTWVDGIKAGRTVTEIAKTENVSTDFILHNIDLAFLSPDLLQTILDGRQRSDVSTASLIKHRWPVDWVQQNSIWIA